jgi:hypothetical protein
MAIAKIKKDAAYDIGRFKINEADDKLELIQKAHNVSPIVAVGSTIINRWNIETFEELFDRNPMGWRVGELVKVMEKDRDGNYTEVYSATIMPPSINNVQGLADGNPSFYPPSSTRQDSEFIKELTEENKSILQMQLNQALAEVTELRNKIEGYRDQIIAKDALIQEKNYNNMVLQAANDTLQKNYNTLLSRLETIEKRHEETAQALQDGQNMNGIAELLGGLISSGMEIWKTTQQNKMQQNGQVAQAPGQQMINGQIANGQAMPQTQAVYPQQNDMNGLNGGLN